MKPFLVVFSILTLIPEFFLHRHGHFGDHSIDGYFGFFGALALLGLFVSLIIIKGLTCMLVKGEKSE